MYLLRDAGGWRAQERLWEMLTRSVLQLVDLPSDGIGRARELMRKYLDLPMGLADATLVAVGEARGIRQVLTLDSDFSIYRLRGRLAFEVVPPPGKTRSRRKR